MKKNALVYRLTILALLIGMILLFWYGVGTINLGFIAITLSCLPVIIGTMVLGLKSGLILGFAFGLISFITGLERPSGLIAPIFSANIIWGAVLCFIPRILVPVVTKVLFDIIKNKDKKVWIALPAAAGSLTNTVLFLGFILLLYGVLGIEDPKLLSLIGTTVLVGGIPEAAVAALVCPSVLFALKKARLIS